MCSDGSTKIVETHSDQQRFKLYFFIAVLIRLCSWHYVTDQQP